MSKPSLSDQIRQMAVKVVKEANDKLQRDYLDIADLELHVLFGIDPIQWEAQLFIGHFRFQESDESPILALQKLVSSILAADLNHFSIPR